MEPAKSAFRTRYEEIYNSPEIVRKRIRARWHCVCLLCVSPFGFLAIEICQRLVVPPKIYFPIVSGTMLMVARMVGLYIAKKKGG